MIQTSLMLAGKRILVVDDTVENVRLYRALLKMEGAQVLESDRARAGIEVATREQPDMILMDMQMPGMDGLTALRLLRADPRTRQIPIIIVTAAAMDHERRAILDSGCDGFIAKPFDPTAFTQQIAGYLEQSELQGSLLKTSS